MFLHSWVRGNLCKFKFGNFITLGKLTNTRENFVTIQSIIKMIEHSFSKISKLTIVFYFTQNYQGDLQTIQRDLRHYYLLHYNSVIFKTYNFLWVCKQRRLKTECQILEVSSLGQCRAKRPWWSMRFCSESASYISFLIS